MKIRILVCMQSMTQALFVKELFLVKVLSFRLKMWQTRKVHRVIFCHNWSSCTCVLALVLSFKPFEQLHQNHHYAQTKCPISGKRLSWLSHDASSGLHPIFFFFPHPSSICVSCWPAYRLPTHDLPRNFLTLSWTSQDNHLSSIFPLAAAAAAGEEKINQTVIRLMSWNKSFAIHPHPMLSWCCPDSRTMVRKSFTERYSQGRGSLRRYNYAFGNRQPIDLGHAFPDGLSLLSHAHKQTVEQERRFCTWKFGSDFPIFQIDRFSFDVAGTIPSVWGVIHNALDTGQRLVRSSVFHPQLPAMVVKRQHHDRTGVLCE